MLINVDDWDAVRVLAILRDWLVEHPNEDTEERNQAIRFCKEIEWQLGFIRNTERWGQAQKD